MNSHPTLYPLLLLTIFALTVSVSTSSGQLTDYEAQQDSWRETREANLASDDGWLTIAALHFLHEGANSFGSSPLNDFVLPEGPEKVGVFELRGREVFLRTEEGQAVDGNGKRTTTTRLFPTESIRHDVTVGNLTLWIHYSGDRLAVRMSDPNSDILKNFSGLKWFPVDERYRVPARFIPHDNPTAVKLPNILGDIEEFTSHGSVELTVAGQKVRMLSIHSGDQLWFIFRDLTSGVETYPAARFLYAPAPGEDGWTEVDINRAYNPPCAFNPYTTCPLPPEPNRLNFRVEAGELTYH